MINQRFRKNELVELLLSKGVVGIKPEGITLKLGRVSHWYANCRILSATKALREKTAWHFVNYIDDNKIDFGDCVLGVPQGATLLGQQVQDHFIDVKRRPDRVFFPRDKPKEHGDKANKYWVTGEVPENGVYILENVTTTLASSKGFIEMLQSREVNVKGLIALLNRRQLDENGKTAEEICADMGLEYHALVTAEDLIKNALIKHLGEEYSNDCELKRIIEKEYEEEYRTLRGETPPKLF